VISRKNPGRWELRFALALRKMDAGYFASRVGKKGAQPVACFEWKKERPEGGIEHSEGDWSLLLGWTENRKEKRVKWWLLYHRSTWRRIDGCGC
jgi:hypothetical protein